MDGPPAIKRSLETTLEREPDGVDNATHARLDKAVLDTTGDYAFNSTFSSRYDCINLRGNAGSEVQRKP